MRGCSLGDWRIARWQNDIILIGTSAGKVEALPDVELPGAEADFGTFVCGCQQNTKLAHIQCYAGRSTIVSHMTNIASVEAGIAEGMRLVLAAERAYRTLDGHASSFRAAAEDTHYNLLRKICQLTEEEADSIEPAFTQFEICLARFSTH